MNKYEIKLLDDECYPFVAMPATPSGLDATHSQKTAAFKKWKLDDQGMTWPDFFHTAMPTFGCDGAIAVRWCNMVLCIEADGYTHT